MLKTSDDELKIPAEWAEKITGDAQKDDETVRAMLASIDSPEIAAIRSKVSSLRTSELMTVFSSPLALLERHIGEGCFERFSNDEQGLVIAACVAAVTDEIDRRIPIPKTGAP